MKTFVDLNSWLAKHKPGDHVRLQVQRREGERTVDVLLAENPALEVVTYERAGQAITSQVAEFREAWLSSKALHPLPHIPAMP